YPRQRPSHVRTGIRGGQHDNSAELSRASLAEQISDNDAARAMSNEVQPLILAVRECASEFPSQGRSMLSDRGAHTGISPGTDHVVLPSQEARQALHPQRPSCKAMQQVYKFSLTTSQLR